MTLNYYVQMNQSPQKSDKIKKVAAYCRVSTDKEDQANSYESQKSYFRDYISHHPDWELYEVFSDEGLSGTSTQKRIGFNKMIAAAKKEEFDLIITKEISRFARNTLDSIYYTRMLKEHGVGVIFLNDNINTLDGDAELRLAIMSSIAQEESRKTSERVKWGQKRQMEHGVVFGGTMLGYDILKGRMYLNPDGARIVRMIFHKFVEEGKGCHVIARELTESGIKPMKGQFWQDSVILRILKNEKYCGDLVQKKTFTPNYLSHKKKYNRGEEEFVIIENHHEPIITRKMYEQANAILKQRSKSQCGNAKYSNRYPFSGKIKCGFCGASFVARSKKRKDGSVYRIWRCQKTVKQGILRENQVENPMGCSAPSIREEDVRHILQLVVSSLNWDRGKVIRHLIGIIQMNRCTHGCMQEIESALHACIDRTDGCLYTQILDKIVILGPESINVYLKFLPFKWSFSVRNN